MNKFLLFAAAAVLATPSALSQDPVPADVTGFEVSFNYNNGSPVVSGKFKAPTTGGDYWNPEPITTVARIEVTRTCYDTQEYDLPVAKFENATAGQEYTFDDTTIKKFGTQYNYTVSCYNSAGESGYGAFSYIYAGVQPEAPEIISVTTGEKGSAPVTITVKAPSRTVGGEEIPCPLTELRLCNHASYYQTDLLESIPNPEAGKEYTFVHNGEQGVRYTYQITAVTGWGEGESASQSVFIGEDVPGSPVNLSAETVDGKVVLSWEAPSTGKNDGYFDPATVLYRVCRVVNYEEVPLATDLAGLTFTDPCEDLTGPVKLDYTVTACNALGNGGTATLTGVVAGPSQKLPFVENFNSGSGYFIQPDNLWTTDPAQWSAWEYETSSWYVDGLTGVDHDGYAFANYRYATPGQRESLISSPIDCKDAQYPVLTFYYAAMKDVAHRISVGVTRAGAERVELASFAVSDNAPADAAYVWVKKTIPLETAAGAEIRIDFEVLNTAGDMDNIYIDAIRIDDYPPVAAINVEAKGTTVLLSWDAPSNSTMTAGVYDVYLDDTEPIRVEEPSCTLATEAETEYKVAVTAIYNDVPSCKSETVTFNSGDTSSVSTIAAGKAVTVEYFDVSGRKIDTPSAGMFLIKRTTASDGSKTVEKTVFK